MTQERSTSCKTDSAFEHLRNLFVPHPSLAFCLASASTFYFFQSCFALVDTIHPGSQGAIQKISRKPVIEQKPNGTTNTSSTMPYRQKHRVSLFLLVISLFISSICAVNPRKRKDGNPNSRYITIHNESKRTIDLFWIQPQDGSLGPSNTQGEGITYGAQTGIASFIGHDFEVREMGKCEALGQCRKTQFQCKKAEDQGKRRNSVVR